MPAAKNNLGWWIAGIGLVILVAYAMGKFLDSVLASLDDWQPDGKHTSEIAHRTALAKYLRSRLSDRSIIEEYRKERSHADIAVGNASTGLEQSNEKIALELKYLLKDKGEADRLVGQCVGYQATGFSKVVVLLIDADPNTIEVLKNRAAASSLSGFMLLRSFSTEPRQRQTAYAKTSNTP